MARAALPANGPPWPVGGAAAGRVAANKEQPDFMATNNGSSGGPGPWGNPGGSPGNSGSGNGGSGHGGSGNGGSGNSGSGGGGSGGGGNSPWGDRPKERPTEKPPFRGPGSGGPGGVPPDLDELIEKVQNFVRGLLPPGFGQGNGQGRGNGRTPAPAGRGRGALGLWLVAAAVVALWLASGFYRVQPDEQGVVLRFGAYSRTTLPGLNYHLPWPAETVMAPQVTRINRVEIGYRSAGPDGRIEAGRDASGRDVLEESLMLTGDENIIDIDFAVFWRIRDAGDFLFKTRHPEYTVKSAAESVMREVIGRTPIQPALTEGRAQIELSVMQGVQAILDQYGTGVEITQVQLQKVDPPAAVIDSFRDVQRANTDADRMRNEAESYHNDIVPRARGEAARIVAEADATRQANMAEATGQAQRFLSVLKAYNAAKDVTMQRLYIETMQDILSHTPTLIVDQGLQGVVPYLPLGEHGTTARPLLPAPPASGTGAIK
jgi:membrane protease subunit HflK